MFLVKYLIRFLVAHSIISKETIRALIGWFLYVQLVVGPIIIGSFVLLALRKMNTRAICIMNLIFASGATLLVIGAISNIRELVVDLVAVFWLAGAMGLFFRKRLAWIGSVIGTGTAVAFSATLVVTLVTNFLYPDAEMNHTKEFSIAGYALTLFSGLTQFSLLFAICLRLLLGLFKIRKELFVTS